MFANTPIYALRQSIVFKNMHTSINYNIEFKTQLANY